MSTESAYPDRLLAYASGAKGDTNALRSAGKKLSAAIQEFTCSRQDPQVLSSLTDWGEELTGYASKKSLIDEWVHDVGVRFQSADGGDGGARTTITAGVAVTFTQVVAQRRLAAQEKRLQDMQDGTEPGQWGPLGQQPYPDNGPEAEPAPPGWQQRAAAKQAFLNWLSGGDDNPDDGAGDSFPDVSPSENLKWRDRWIDPELWRLLFEDTDGE